MEREREDGRLGGEGGGWWRDSSFGSDLNLEATQMREFLVRVSKE